MISVRGARARSRRSAWRRLARVRQQKQLPRPFLDKEVFLVPSDQPGETIVYAPLLALALTINSRAAQELERLRQGELVELQPSFAEPLERVGILSRKRRRRRHLESPLTQEFRPTALSLFLTGDCNLRCSYCYSCGGESPATMPVSLALDALQWVLDNASRADRCCSLHFHGGGEPTIALEEMKLIAAKARAESEERGLRLDLTLGTNGVLEESTARWVARTMNHITLSLDGDAEIQDAQRARPNGLGSYGDVLRTAKMFEECAANYSLRMTVTTLSVDRLDSQVEHLVRHTQAKRIKAEPLFVQGRAKTLGLKAPEADRFLNAFLRAKAVARAAGRQLLYSGCRPETVTDRFCGAAGHSLGVTPSGILTACYEVTDPADERAPLFFFGRYRGEGKGFEIDASALGRLRRLTLLQASECRDCFARWHCAGDCPAKTLTRGSLESSGPLQRSWRCQINRELTRHELIEAVRSGEDLLGGSNA